MKQRSCSLCHQPGHRRDNCPTAGASRPALRGRSPKSPAELVAVLVAAAEALGEDKALAAVEEATGEVLRRSQAMRLALLKSRAANAKLRARLDDQREAKVLAKLDAEEKVAE